MRRMVCGSIGWVKKRMKCFWGIVGAKKNGGAATPPHLTAPINPIILALRLPSQRPAAPTSSASRHLRRRRVATLASTFCWCSVL